MMRIDIKGEIIPNDYKEVYDWYGVESTCPNDVSEKLTGEDVEVFINSGGGSVFDGVEIYSMLREYAGNVKIYITGLAASAASIVAMARDSVIEPAAMLMVHNVSGGANGDFHEMEKMADVLKKINDSLASAYSEKSGMTKEEAVEMMDAETWLTAEEAVNRGLIDSINKPDGMMVASFCQSLTKAQIEEARKAISAKKKAEAIIQAMKDSEPEGGEDE